MEKSSSKTIMCSVFFLDIVEYSKRSVAGQISLKERFNHYLSAAIRDVPLSDRIILDTGDGAAINFMGDVEDALKAALSLRSSMLHEGRDVEPPLLVRMGINLGPVRLIRDINGQPNIVGDGINVAQRVMGFADPSQILVSRSYFDAVSRLSPQYAGMFHYQGSRTDKHVREHEVYAIGYPGDKTSRPHAVQDGRVKQPGKFAKISKPLNTAWHFVLKKTDTLLEYLLSRYSKVTPEKRPLVVAAVGIPLVVMAVLSIKIILREPPPVPAKVVVARAPRMLPASSGVYPTVTLATASGVPASGVMVAQKPALPSATPIRPKMASTNIKVFRPSQTLSEKDKVGQGANSAINKLLGFSRSGDDADNAKISLSCMQGTILFVDGVKKGQMTSGDMVIDVIPGKHAVIAILPNQKLFNQSVEIAAGKMVKIKPFVCGK